MTTRQHVDPVGVLAQQVRHARRSQHLTQDELAHRAFVSRSFVIELEGGHPRAELGKTLNVIRALNLHPFQGLFTATPDEAASAETDVAESLALIEKGQQLAGHHPSDEALARAGRVLTGETPVEDARAELARKYPRSRA